MGNTVKIALNIFIFLLISTYYLYAGSDFTVSIIEANVNARTTYPLQSNISSREIEQDQNNPLNINACWMVSLSGGPSWADRNIRYFISTNGGGSFNYVSPLTTTRSGFPVLDLLNNGSVIIGCHSSDLTGNNTTVHLYYNSAPGSSSFQVITPGAVNSNYPIWPQLTVGANDKIIFTGSGSYRNICNSLTPPGTFSGYVFDPQLNSNNQLAISSSGNRIAIAYIANSADLNRIYIKESTDGGNNFSAPLLIWDYSSDSLSGLRGIDCSYDGNTPNVVFEVCKIPQAGTYDPKKPSKLYFWSPLVNSGTAKMIDSMGGLSGNSTHGYTSISRPAIGYSNPPGYIYVAYSRSRLDTNVIGENYFDVYLAYSSNAGQSWSIPQQVTNVTGTLVDNKYVSISNKNKIANNIAEVHLLFQQDTVPQLIVPPVNNAFAKMMYAKLTMPVIGIQTVNSEIPEEFILKQNYPNPFNPVTQIEFSVPKTSIVKIKIYNSIGELITVIASDRFIPGTYKTDFNAAELSSGVYYYIMEYSDEVSGSRNSISKKMVVVK